MRIRLAQPSDLGALMRLCAEHAIYERAVPPGPEAAPALAAALWDLVRGPGSLSLKNTGSCAGTRRSLWSSLPGPGGTTCTWTVSTYANPSEAGDGDMP